MITQDEMRPLFFEAFNKHNLKTVSTLIDLGIDPNYKVPVNIPKYDIHYFPSIFDELFERSSWRGLDQENLFTSTKTLELFREKGFNYFTVSDKTSNSAIECARYMNFKVILE